MDEYVSYKELEPIFMQGKYSATVKYDPESGFTVVTLLLKDNMKFNHKLKAKVFPGHECQKGMHLLSNDYEDVKKEEQRAKEALAFAIQETIEIYEKWRENNE